MNNELMRFASPSAEGLVRHDMARTAALKADLAMLEGTGGTQIKGLLTYSGITAHTASTAWLMRKTMYAALMNRRADAVTAADGKGSFLFHPTRHASDTPPAELYG